MEKTEDRHQCCCLCPEVSAVGSAQMFLVLFDPVFVETTTRLSQSKDGLFSAYYIPKKCAQVDPQGNASVG